MHDGSESTFEVAGLAVCCERVRLPGSSVCLRCLCTGAGDALQKVGGLFLSWPYITVALVLTFFFLFRDSLAAAIGRVQKVKGLGGEVELQVQPPAKREEPTTTDKEARAEEIEAQVTAHITPEGTEATPVQFPDEVINILTFIGEPVPADPDDARRRGVCGTDARKRDICEGGRSAVEVLLPLVFFSAEFQASPPLVSGRTLRKSGRVRKRMASCYN